MTEIQEPLESYREYPGPILLLAGPGTGKTFQLANRVKFLLDVQGASPEEISIITFTSAAARNMRERLEKPYVSLNVERQPKIITTMHSLGNMIIGTAADKLGLPSEYGVLTNPRIREVVLEDASYLISGDRKHYKEADDCRRCGACNRDDSLLKCQICAKYIDILRKCAVIDYDDQILLACEILERDQQVASEWRSRTRYLLIDEYQDINQAQFCLIKLLSQGQCDGLFAVGDDDQSIYSFRGGTPDYIRGFSSCFPEEIRIGRLAKSWRCPEHILSGAKCVIENFYPGSEPKPDPTFPPERACSEKITFWDVPSDTWEASIIAGEIQSQGDEERVIIIIPNSKYFPPIRDALRKKGIPYRYRTAPSEEGIVRFAVLADWAEKPQDSLLLRHLADLIIQNHDDLLKCIRTGEGGIKQKRTEASNLLATLWDCCGQTISMYDIITERASADTDQPFFLELKRDCLDQMLCLINEYGGKRAKLSEFLEQAGLLIAPGKNARGVIDEIREWRNDLSSSGTGSARTPVEIYNIPSSKGLEGHVVFVVGATQELMPNPNGDLEEQARLFYVAMTRARRRLHLFSSRSRPASITFKQGSYQMTPSPFVRIIAPAHMESKYIHPKKNNTRQDKATVCDKPRR